MGSAKLAFATLQISDAGEYDAIKGAILARYNINEEAYRNRFWTVTKKDGETNHGFSVRLMDLVKKSRMRDKKTIDQVQDVIGIEQLLNSLLLEKRLWLVEKKLDTSVQAGELVDEFEQARCCSAEGEFTVSVKKAVQCSYCERSGHKEGDCRRTKQDVGDSAPERLKCYKCHGFGDIAGNCMAGRRAMFGNEKKCFGVIGEQKVLRQGIIEGKMTVLLNTGCSRTMVHRNLVPTHKLIEGKGVAIRCAHSDTTFYLLADIEVKVSGKDLKVEAAVADTLPVPLLLGTDVPQLFQILGREDSGIASVDNVMVVRTRARA